MLTFFSKLLQSIVLQSHLLLSLDLELIIKPALYFCQYFYKSFYKSIVPQNFMLLHFI